MSNLDELREFIELWIPINVKDAQHVKEAKIEARKEFLDKVSQYTQQETLKARIDELNGLLNEPEVSYTARGVKSGNAQSVAKRLEQLTTNNSKETAPNE